MWLHVRFDSDLVVYVNENSIKKIIQIDREEDNDGMMSWHTYYYDIHYVDGNVDKRVRISTSGKLKKYESKDEHGARDQFGVKVSP